MRIGTSTAPTMATLPASTNQAATADSAPQDSAHLGASGKEKFNKMVTGAAYTAGGGMGGLVLGGLGGAMLTNMTGNPVFAANAGLVGAVAGGVSGLAASYSDEPGTLKRTLVAWTGATAGTALGMWVMGAAGPALTAHGASALFGTSGQLIGATAGGLLGAAVSFTGHHARVSEGVKHIGSMATGTALGLVAGGLVQVAANAAGATLPAPVYAAAPLLLGATGALVGLTTYINRREIAAGF